MKHKRRKVIGTITRKAYVTPEVNVKPAPEVKLPPVKVFAIEPSTALQAHKIEEEAHEVVDAVLRGDFKHTLYELMDVHQTVGNMVHKMGYTDEQIKAAYADVVKNNERRGRYDG